MPEERPDLIELIDTLDANIAEVRRLSAAEGIDRSADIGALEADRDRLIGDYFSQLSAWDQVRLARHPRRPYTQNYLHSAFDDFVELHGDRLFGDDAAMVAGFGWIGGYPVFTYGQQKGRDIMERRLRNFGSAKPEGYRKALRMMRLAEKLKRPIVAIVDTPAADCSVESEERGVSEAIARNLVEMFRISTPIVVVIIGEGGSGGAIGIGVGDRILMMEHAIYSVIPPEGCAAILWRDPNRKVEAAEALRLTADNAKAFGLVDEVIPEPFGGAHRDPEAAAMLFRQHIIKALDEIVPVDMDVLLTRRYAKFRAMGLWEEGPSAVPPNSATETKPDSNGRKKRAVPSKNKIPRTC